MTSPWDKIVDNRNNLTIYEGRKQRHLKVNIIGDLALEFDDVGDWAIHHVPTLTRFDTAVPARFTIVEGQDKEDFNYTKEQLLNWMHRIQYECPLEKLKEGITVQQAFETLRGLTRHNYKDKGETAKDIVFECCQSIKVE